MEISLNNPSECKGHWEQRMHWYNCVELNGWRKMARKDIGLSSGRKEEGRNTRQIWPNVIQKAAKGRGFVFWTFKVRKLWRERNFNSWYKHENVGKREIVPITISLLSWDHCCHSNLFSSSTKRWRSLIHMCRLFSPLHFRHFVTVPSKLTTLYNIQIVFHSVICFT